jgi:hypothetical protein
MDVQNRVKCCATRERPDYRRATEELTGSSGKIEFRLKPRVNSSLCSVSTTTASMVVVRMVENQGSHDDDDSGSDELVAVWLAANQTKQE